ncbi:MAG: hypothetical protein G8345_04265 [Magnetococcales bacterium]|nr:hypothetical protein [Magnetococcales bacterium]NGZ26085.1 hypothetical protein [Magnetococcales bacterium]
MIHTYKKIDLCCDQQEGEQPSAYLVARNKITQFMIRYILVESYQKFVQARKPYPFVPANSLRPGSVTPTKEYTLHNNALVVFLEDVLPVKLRKHFRCRPSNRMLKGNILSVAPDLQGMETYEPSMRRVLDDGFEDLMRIMLPLDFSLLIQNAADPEDAPDYELTNFHVKIERLTENALCNLGMHLNYLEKTLYEHGEDFVEIMERKFLEYFNFYHNAAGRRTAAALAGQLISRERLTGTIYIASQQDRRLTLLSTCKPNPNVEVEQFLLQPLDSTELARLRQWGKEHQLDINQQFLVRRNPGVVVVRVRYQHTDAAYPTPDGSLRKGINPRERWIRLVEEAIVPYNGGKFACGGHTMAYRRSLHSS